MTIQTSPFSKILRLTESWMHYLAVIAAIIILSRCATHKLSKADRIYEKARVIPLDDRPAFYLQSLKDKSLKLSEYYIAMDGWSREKSIADAKTLESSQDFTAYAADLRVKA